VKNPPSLEGFKLTAPDGKISLQIMRSFFEKKYWVLLISILALGALTVLSFSLKSVKFDEAQPVGWGEPSSFLGGGAGGSSLFGVSLEMQVGLFISLLILAGLVSLLISAEARKRFLRLVLNLAITYWVLTYVIKKYPDMLSALNPDSFSEIPPPSSGEVTVIPSAVFTPPEQTPLLSYAISVLILLVMAFSMWYLYRVWKKMNPPKSQSALDEIAKIARATLKDLSASGNSADVITNCYVRMSDVVADKKNIYRGLSMTPTEFATSLERSGLPGDAVRNLTRLFESVRYGGNKVGPKETNEAVACLTTIVHYCGETI
jgi:hypothetical protein